MSQYVPVPVAAARQIAAEYEKQVVAIVSLDRPHVRVHVTTFGETAEDKLAASNLGDLLAKAAGLDVVLQTPYEDFRDRTAAGWAVERQAMIDLLNRFLKIGRGIDHAFSSLLAVREGIADELLSDLQAELQLTRDAAKQFGGVHD